MTTRRPITFSCLFPLALAIAVCAVPAHAATTDTPTYPLGITGLMPRGEPLPVALRSFVAEDVSADYTGILIDVRQCPDITRSMSPAVYGPSPDFPLVYPDRSHVPTPDEVQDESIVRYYHTLDDAAKGVAGANPLVLPAVSVTGYAKDSVVLTATEMKQMMDLDQQLHFTRTWKVGFLIPPDK